MALKPLSNRVVIKFAEVEEKTQSGIILTASAQEKPQIAEIIAVGAGKVEDGKIVPATTPVITTQCLRVPVTDGHMAAVFVTFKNKPSKEEILKKVIGNDERITCRPADLLEPEYEKFKAEMKEYYTQEEDVLSYALFNQVAINFFKYRLAKEKQVDADLAKSKIYPV